VKFVFWSIGLQDRVLVWNLYLNLKKEAVCSTAMSVTDCVIAQKTTRVFIRQPV